MIDTYTNLILLLDKYIGNKISTEKTSYDFGTDADYGRGAKSMKNELGLQLQKLANQGFLILNIVHAEQKTDFASGRNYIGTSLSNSLYGVAEKFVDQIVYLRRDVNPNTGKMEHSIWFNPKGGFSGAGGRFTPKVDSVPCSFVNLENALLEAMDDIGASTGAKLVETDKPSVTIEEVEYDYDALMEEFQTIAGELMNKNQVYGPRITKIIEKHLGKGRKISETTPDQAEFVSNIIQEIKTELMK